MKNFTFIISLLIAFMITSCSDNKTKNNKENYSTSMREILPGRNLNFVSTNHLNNTMLNMAHNNAEGMEVVRDLYTFYLIGIMNFELALQRVFNQDDNADLIETKTSIIGIVAIEKNHNMDETTLVIMRNGRITALQQYVETDNLNNGTSKYSTP